MVSYRYDDELPTKLKTPMLCRREGFEEVYKNRTYCTIADECIYKDSKDEHGYRCLLLEKQVRM